MADASEPSKWQIAQGPLRWSGQRWVPADGPPQPGSEPGLELRRSGSHPKWLKVLFGSWFVGVGLWVPAVGIAHSVARRDSHAVALSVVVSAAVGVIFTAVVGYLLGSRGMWQQVAIATGLGTGALLFWYCVAWVVLVPASETTADNSAGAGVVLLFFPTLAAISAVLYLGGLIGRLRPARLTHP